jgi:hypothetical protein
VATVYLRNGIYYAKFFDEHGRRTSRNTGVPKKREAQQIAAAMEVEVQELRRKTSDKQRGYSHILETAVREARAGDLTLARAEELLRRLRSMANPDFREVTFTGWFAEWIDAQRPHVGDSTIRVTESNWQVTTEMERLGLWHDALDDVDVYLVPVSFCCYGWFLPEGHIYIPGVTGAQLSDLITGQVRKSKRCSSTPCTRLSPKAKNPVRRKSSRR